MLELLRQLVDFGYYATRQKVLSILPALRDLINGVDDKAVETKVAFSENEAVSLAWSSQCLCYHGNVCFTQTREQMEKEWRTKGRFEATGGNQLLVKCKRKALGVIDSLLNLTSGIRLMVCSS